MNELGIRDTSYNKDADIKILVLGNSGSWGDRVYMERAYPYLLEWRLNKRVPDRTYEVINSGVPG